MESFWRPRSSDDINLRSLLNICVGVANGSLLRDFSSLCHELVVNTRLDISPGSGHAALASVSERSTVSDEGGLFD